MLFLIFNEIEKPKKDLIYFLFFSFWVQYLTVLLALDLKTACEDGGVLLWFRRRWLWRQFDTISGHGWNRERTQLTKRSTPHNRLHWIAQRSEDSSEENCQREQTIGSYRKLTKRSTPNYCFHSNLRRPHCLLFVLCTDADNTHNTLQAILSKRSRPYNRLHPSPVIRSKGVPWCSMNDFHAFKYHCWPSWTQHQLPLFSLGRMCKTSKTKNTQTETKTKAKSPKPKSTSFWGQKSKCWSKYLS